MGDLNYDEVLKEFKRQAKISLLPQYVGWSDQYSAVFWFLVQHPELVEKIMELAETEAFAD